MSPSQLDTSAQIMTPDPKVELRGNAPVSDRAPWSSIMGLCFVLVANDPPPAAALKSEDFFDHKSRVLLVHSTKQSKLLLAAGMDHIVEGPDGTDTWVESAGDVGRVTIAADLVAGQCLRVTRFLAYGWSSQRSLPAVRDEVVAALAEARHTSWEGLVVSQHDYLDDFWDRADVELEGDPELQLAVRLALFHTLQAGPRAAGDALRWRHSTLDLARDRARQLGLKGAAFPWRTIRGHEFSGYGPASTAAFHISADIADAVVRYQAATEDDAFQGEVGIELLVETARLWRSLGHYDAKGNFRIDGVTGPDEYSALADNNVYTNLMAQRNLCVAADCVERYPDAGAKLV